MIHSHYRNFPLVNKELMGCGIADRSVPAQEHQINRNIDNGYVIVIITEGHGVYINHDGLEFPLKKGQGFQRIPGLQHQYIIPPQKTYAEYFLHIPKSLYYQLKNYYFSYENLNVLQVELNQILLQTFKNLIQELQTAKDEELIFTVLKIVNLMARINFDSSTQNDAHKYQKIINQATELINQNLAPESNLPLVLQQLPISYERLRKIFKEKTGQSIGSYRINKRLEAAQNLIIKQEFTISEVAHSLGYKDPFMFSKQFKKFIGVSPENYLKKFLSLKS